jgi:ribosomal protein S18 acetylase RimI-like enzyme
LFVDPEHRTVGAGRMLMTAALDHASSVGRSVALDVMAKDRGAIRLYERLGGQRLGETVHFYGTDSVEPSLVFAFW